MDFLENTLIQFKKLFVDAISTGGVQGKQSLIRSSKHIDLVHDAIKKQLINLNVDPIQIKPPFLASKPEIKVAGLLKQKKQDVTVLPKNIKKLPTKIDWDPLRYEKINDCYGKDYSERMLIINVRSQMSSIAKNADTLFERTFAEASNLHLRYPKCVLGELYLIPCHEFDDELAKNKVVGYKQDKTKLEKYISFFSTLNNRKYDPTDNTEAYKYERVALLIVDFRQDIPQLYSNSAELKAQGLLEKDFPLELAELSFQNFSKDLLEVYAQRFDLSNLIVASPSA